MGSWVATLLIMPFLSLLRRADGFGSLVGIVTIRRLELVDKRDIFSYRHLLATCQRLPLSAMLFASLSPKSVVSDHILHARTMVGSVPSGRTCQGQ